MFSRLKIFLIISLNTFAQDKKWSLIILGSIDANKQHAEQMINTTYYQSLKTKIERQSLFSDGSSLGINIGYKINRFEILTGFEYVRQTNKDSIHLYNYGTNYISYNAEIHHYYAIPILFKYNILKEKFNLYSFLGADYKHFLGLETTNTEFRKHHCYIRFGVGTDIPISEKISFLIESNFSFSLNNLYINNPNNGFKYYPYSIEDQIFRCLED